MTEKRLKIRISRILRSPLSSCKSKDQTNDVVESQPSRRRYQLIELFSPLPSRPFTFSISPMAESKLPLLSPDVNGRKCPPVSPIISPLNSLCFTPKEKKKQPTGKKKLPYRKCSGFEDRFPDLKYNGLFSSDEEDGRRASFSAAGSRRRMDVEDSLAVVKRSSDPYSDFRISMVEMIVEKQIFGARDLENLLHCFLSLNSHHHHQIIIQVFDEIWEALLL